MKESLNRHVFKALEICQRLHFVNIHGQEEKGQKHTRNIQRTLVSSYSKCLTNRQELSEHVLSSLPAGIGTVGTMVVVTENRLQTVQLSNWLNFEQFNLSETFVKDKASPAV